MPKNASLLSAPGSNFGLGRVQPTRQQGLATLGLLADLTPAGDVMAMGQGVLNRDPLGFGLGAASLLLPGTIKPDFAKDVLSKFRTTLDDSISRHGTKEFNDELEYIMDGMEVPDKGIALDDMLDLIDEGELPAKLRTPARKIGIDAGIYREVPEDEISRTLKGKPFDFKIGGKPFKFNDEFQSIRKMLFDDIES